MRVLSFAYTTFLDTHKGNMEHFNPIGANFLGKQCSYHYTIKMAQQSLKPLNEATVLQFIGRNCFIHMLQTLLYLLDRVVLLTCPSISFQSWAELYLNIVLVPSLIGISLQSKCRCLVLHEPYCTQVAFQVPTF